MDPLKKKLFGVVSSSAVGSAAGLAATKVAGLNAVGMIGGGAGIGWAAGPVGALGGAVVGLAGYGLYKLFSEND